MDEKEKSLSELLRIFSESSSITPFNPPLPIVRTRRENFYYRNKKIDIEGCDFINCRFDSCELLVEKGDFTFKDCVIDETTKIILERKAMRIYKIIAREKSTKQDGTITIE